jgi:hypothetical protein
MDDFRAFVNADPNNDLEALARVATRDSASR